MSLKEWLLLAPLLLSLAGALAGLVADAFLSPRAATRTAAVALAAAAGLFAYTAFIRAAVAGGVVLLGGVYAAVGAFVCALAALTLTSGESSLGSRPHGGQVAALVAFTTTASVVLLGAFDLTVFVVALEMIALGGYALVASARTARAYEAAMKYFVQGAIATGLLVYGVAVLFGLSGGALGFDALGRALAAGAGKPAATVALVLMLSAVAFKLGAFPFHSWAPDAYETAPPSVAAFLASVPKVAALLATVLLLVGVFGGAPSQREPVWALLVAIIAAASIAFGNLAALRQASFRRMLAYSGIAQVGYALTGMSAGSRVQPFAVLVFGVFYALAAAGAFLAAEAAGEGEGWDGSIASLAGLGRRRPVLAASLAVCLLSLTGIPLTAGFWGKLLVFASASTTVLWLAIVGVVGSVVSFGYYGGVLRAVYLDETAEAPEPAPARVEEILEGSPAFATRSVGAMAADAPSERRRATWPVAVVAILVLVGGLAPLFFLRLFGG